MFSASAQCQGSAFHSLANMLIIFTPIRILGRLPKLPLWKCNSLVIGIIKANITVNSWKTKHYKEVWSKQFELPTDASVDSDG